MDSQAKIDSIHINFGGDTVLPRLNVETLEKFGFEDKPVLLKKGVIVKNTKNHPEVSKSEYKEIIASALYKPDAVLVANLTKPYYNFISQIKSDKSAIVLLQVEDVDCLEIINMHWVSDYGRRKKERLAKRIDAKK